MTSPQCRRHSHRTKSLLPSAKRKSPHYRLPVSHRRRKHRRHARKIKTRIRIMCGMYSFIVQVLCRIMPTWGMSEHCTLSLPPSSLFTFTAFCLVLIVLSRFHRSGRVYRPHSVIPTSLMLNLSLKTKRTRTRTVCTYSLQSEDPSHICLMPLASVRIDEGYYRNDYPDADTDEWSSNEGGERFLTFFLLHSAFV